jgi:hypothetical protein
MPSLHFGWDVLVAIAIGAHVRGFAMRAFAVLLPIVMLGGIVLTANHYFLDAAAGALVAVMGLAVAYLIRRGLRTERSGFFNFLA